MTEQQKRTAGVAIASLVLGILGLACLGPLGAIPAVICGHIAWSKIRHSAGVLQGEGLALAGLITGYIGIALIPLMAAIAIPSFVKARDTAQRNICVNNMRQLDAAKDQAAIKHGYTDGATIPESEFAEFLRDGFSGLECPKGGRYTINPYGQDPACSEHGALSGAIDRR